MAPGGVREDDRRGEGLQRLERNIPMRTARNLLPSPSRRRSLLVGGTVLVTGLVLAGIPGSAPAAGPTTAVAFVPVPAKTVLNGSVAAHGTTSVAVIGGSTTVPSDATTVRLDVTVKGTKAGTITIYAAGVPTPADSVSWGAGSSATATVQESVGLNSKISVTNSSLGSATVTLKITGYSTQVTAAGINGSGGSPGEVLTDTGSGAAWQPASTAVGQATGGIPMPLNAYTQVGAVTVPAGSYWVMFDGDIYDPGAASAETCFLRAPNGGTIDFSFVSTPAPSHDSDVVLQGLFSTANGGTATVQCSPYAGTSPQMYHHSMTALSVGAISGSSVSSFAVPHAAQAPHAR
jgi:hypothetical protein